MNPFKIIRLLQNNSSTTYVRFVAEKGPNCCEKCLRYDGWIFEQNDFKKPDLPIHPNCRCHYETYRRNDAKDKIKILAEISEYTVVETVGPSSLIILDITKITADLATNFNHWVWISKSMARVASEQNVNLDLTSMLLEINQYNTDKDAKGLATFISKMYRKLFKE